MSPWMTPPKIAVNDDMDSFGKVERQTEETAMCATELLNFSM